MIQRLFNGVVALMLAKFVLNDVPHAAGLGGGNGEQEALKSSVRRVVQQLSSKYGIVPPKVFWMPIMDTGWHLPEGIVLTTAWFAALRVDRDMTFKIIPRTVAHEFYHHLTGEQVLTVILPPGIAETVRVRRLEAHEVDADSFAYDNTGVSTEQEADWWNSVVGPELVRTGWVKTVKRKVKERGYIVGPEDFVEQRGEQS